MAAQPTLTVLPAAAAFDRTKPARRFFWIDKKDKPELLFGYHNF
jgi:hypothetical protein